MNKKLIAGTLLGLSGAGVAYYLYRNQKKNEMLADAEIHGLTAPGFEAVRDVFRQNFTERNELGGGCSVFLNGEKAVDLWGGYRDATTLKPWEEETMAVVYSTTKGLAAMSIALAHSRELIDYDEKVAAYWPEFAQNGKEDITVRQLLAHQAGLFAFDEPVDSATVADLDRLAEVMARQTPAWMPGEKQAYHAISLGFYEGELIRRVDPKHRSLGKYFYEEISIPLGLEAYIRLPEDIPNSRLAVIDPPGILEMIWGFPPMLTIDSFNPRSNIYRALIANPGSGIVHDDETVYARDLEVPSGGGVATAAAIAKAYGVFASGGIELGLKKETLDLLAAPAIPSKNGFYDECMRGEAKFSLGFMKPCEAWPFKQPQAYGHPGAGGSIGFADPVKKIGYAYVTNRMGTSLTGDPRETALRDAVYRCVERIEKSAITAAAAGG
ncbi:MAG TPA: serine hydrolase domain-containing protein [Pyrinomonadaceae bacterium]|nr:serine hydrolase domain-containing protein [Pyrinomonadaceae bacterium]